MIGCFYRISELENELSRVKSDYEKIINSLRSEKDDLSQK